METLRSGLADLNITLSSAKLTTLLFEIRKHDLVHVFLPATPKTAQFLKKIPGNIRLTQTVLSAPSRIEDYGNALFGHRVIVFSEGEKSNAAKYAPGITVDCIPPCVALPQLSSLKPSSEVKKMYEIGERMMVLALNDVANRQCHEAFLYIMREYNRRQEFRLIIPRFQTDRETNLWRTRLQETITNENLKSVQLLDGPVDLHSLIDSADVVIHTGREPNTDFGISLNALEAVSLGKPFLCFDMAPTNEVAAQFHKKWACINSEDFIRETRDIAKEAHQLEQLSTEIARAAREKYSVEAVAGHHRKLYRHLLEKAPTK